MQCPHPLTYVIRKGDNLFQIARYHKTTVAKLLARNPGIDPYNLEIGSSITVCPGEGCAKPVKTTGASPRPAVTKETALKDAMRLAWEQHVYWTRMALISIAERLKDQSATIERLLENPYDIAGLFSGFYSADIEKNIARLLTEHLQIGAQLITSLRDGNADAAEALSREWNLNADQMADAFSAINPYYKREELRKMLYDHLALTTDEVAKRLSGDYADDIDAFDRVEAEALDMADYFTSGLIKRFPKKFDDQAS